MARSIFIFVFMTVSFLTACTSSKNSASKKVSKDLYYIKLLAWNEDTINSYQFALAKDNRFFYTIIKKDSSTETKEYYNGTFKYSSDTLYLHYDKGQQPYDVANYLVKEGSGLYLIQYFMTDNKRMFLRLQSLGHRF